MSRTLMASGAALAKSLRKTFASRHVSGVEWVAEAFEKLETRPHPNALPRRGESRSSARRRHKLHSLAFLPPKAVHSVAAELFQSRVTLGRAWFPPLCGIGSHQSGAGAWSGERALAIGGGAARRWSTVRIATTTSGSVISAMTRRRPPQGQAKASTSWTHLSSVAQSMRVSRATVISAGREIGASLFESGSLPDPLGQARPLAPSLAGEFRCARARTWRRQDVSGCHRRRRSGSDTGRSWSTARGCRFRR